MNQIQDFTSGDNLAQWLGQGKTEESPTPTIEDVIPTPKVETPETPKEDTPTPQPPTPTIVSEEEALKAITKTTPTPAGKGQLIKTFIDSGYWENGNVEIKDENGETKIVSLLELAESEDLDDEAFENLKQEQEKLKKEEFDTKFISKEGLDERTLKLIEISRNGGDITELIKIQADIIHPLEGMDVSDEKTQEWLVFQALKNQGLEDIVIANTIAHYKKELVLDQKAEAVIQQINKMYNEQVDGKLREAEERKKAQVEQQKQFKKVISDEIKQFELKDNIKKSIIDLTSKHNSEGVAPIDDLYFELKEKNPKLFAEVALLISNPDIYNEYKGIKVKNETAKKTFMTLLKTDKKVSTSQIPAEKKEVENPLNQFLVQTN